jgi:hypothetical protein
MRGGRGFMSSSWSCSLCLAALAVCIPHASAFVLQPSVRPLQSSALTGRSPDVVAKVGKKAADSELAAKADQEKLLAEILSATEGNAEPAKSAAPKAVLTKPPPPLKVRTAC